MNTNSKLNRYIILLQKAPFILFIESIASNISHPALDGLGVSEGEYFRAIKIDEDSHLRSVITATNGLPDPLSYNIIEALANALSTVHAFPFPYFTSAIWQEHIEWQNIDAKPEPVTVTHDYTIIIDKYTHELLITSGDDFDARSKLREGVVLLSCIDISVPFPQALLKECILEIHTIIMNASIGRQQIYLSRSAYLSVVQTGYDTFHWINLKKLEKGLIAVIKEAGITIEE